MNFRKIQQLSWYMPIDPAMQAVVPHDYRINDLPHLEEIIKTLQAYSDL